ncbi:lysozyme [Rhizobacter sp. SG703]|uniref:lysozyme n=1 Tax=Rhizobacter sp. SG703 TaxID=2587140 RepID=UPI001446FB89|nr:lysozyme [Rhizobacter sp. SG703]NKI94788.1 lysozyme [Rhizobacter sp. SG703]
MKTSPEGRRVLEYFEGRENAAYPDPATGGDPWTIGVGHTGPEVFKGLVWMDDLIDEVLSSDLAKFEQQVGQLINGHPATQGQFDALTLFAFNVGADIDADKIAEGLGDSTLLRKFLAGDMAGAAAEFAKWDKAAGKSMKGLRRRRAAERELFNGATAATAIRVAQITE